MYKKISFLSILVMFVSISFSQENNDSTLVEKFFNLYEEEGIIQSLEYIYSDNYWISREVGVSDTISNQLEKVVNQLGDYFGFELIKKAKLGSCYVVYSYLLKYDRQPLRFVFILYKPNKEWRFQSFKYDGNLGEEMYNTTNVSWDY